MPWYDLWILLLARTPANVRGTRQVCLAELDAAALKNAWRSRAHGEHATERTKWNLENAPGGDTLRKRRHNKSYQAISRDVKIMKVKLYRRR
jgi:hypothetical protein